MRLTRRYALASVGSLAVASYGVAKARVTKDSLRVAGLRVNQVENPVGVQTQDVRLSWQLNTTARATKQTLYRVMAASTAQNLASGHYDLWDSGRVSGDGNLDVAYSGKPLASRQQVWWQVQVWDTHGRTARSAAATWEMGLLAPSDWTAEWIAIENQEMSADRATGLFWITAPPPGKGNTSQFRLNFRLDGEADVDLLTLADQDYLAFIDGTPLDLPLWMPSAFGKRPVATVSRRLNAGSHTLALTPDIDGGSSREGVALKCGMMVRVRYPDGRTRRYGDELARVSSQKPEGWTRPDFDDHGWLPAQKVEGRGQPLPGNGAFLVRREFGLLDHIKSARLYVTALGVYEVYINGARVDDHLLAPESMDFRKTVRYRVHDVTKRLQAGKNVIGGLVGDGWYGSYSAPLGRYAWGDPPLRFLAQLEVTYADGQVETVGTDPHWQISPGPITMCEIYNGEDYDARLEQPGWAKAGFTPSKPWLQASFIAPPPGALVGAISAPIRRKAALAPKTVTKIREDYVIDFGQNFAGWVRVSAKGKAGQTLTLKYAELLNADGSIDQSNLRAARATDTYTFRGDPKGETYEPRFTYHGFRYVQISGLAAAPTKGDLAGIVIHTDLPETGRLRVANPIIQQLWQNSLWSQRSNFMGIPTDCPQRDERLGWMGDANVFWDAASFNMDVAAFTQRWTADIRDAQYDNGAYSNVTPNTLVDIASNTASPGWADAGVVLPWTAWRRYGDTAIIDQNWDAMVLYLDYIQAHSEDHIWNKGHGWDFGDWLAFDAKNPDDPTTPKDLIGTAMAKHSTEALADMAKATGRAGAAETYAVLANDIRSAFIARFVKADGTVGNDSQTSYILALAYDLVPEGLRAASAGKLLENIKRRGNMLTTGFLGTPASLDVLANFGYDSTVYDLLLRTDYPSWGHMIVAGATTTWERWNSDAGDRSMNSFNHYALGAVIGFVYRRIAGIEPIEPGFKTFRVNPVLDQRIKSGGGDYDSRNGRISTDWSVETNGVFSLRVTVPANATAQIYLPTKDPTKVWESGRALSNRHDLRLLGSDEERLIVEVGSGTYSFKTQI
ncbi:alpha-L-rhamnosidase [Asticcacaulis sp. 201]|uniref:alpha-L-rhamnosidase n=1 Tax=Asticcacaulis sp. 201 TaxID=3028787 RepID=UPI002915CC3D|nr:family 78 glycoside hydrolase catalytic domain [Asticcacaulis sp. 201]MDV6331173.1 family 78 glycoside hydrolase catalytic domain [Asticcacaulis sp. 201]